MSEFLWDDDRIFGELKQLGAYNGPTIPVETAELLAFMMRDEMNARIVELEAKNRQLTHALMAADDEMLAMEEQEDDEMNTPPTPTSAAESLAPLWTYDSMGQECAKNATEYSRTHRRASMDDIVKYAYETTMMAMKDQYEAERRRHQARIVELEAENRELSRMVSLEFEQAMAYGPQGDEGTQGVPERWQ